MTLFGIETLQHPLRCVNKRRMVSIMENKPRRANEPGPAGQRAAANLEKLREDRHLRQDELARLVERLGRPMSRQAISKTEQLARRIDVDDLVALALALDTTPNRLLLSGDASDTEPVELTPEVRVSALDAWRWAAGEKPLPADTAPPDRQMLVRDDRERMFMRENQPHHDPVLTRQTAALVQAAQEHGVQLSELTWVVENAWMRRRLGLLLDDRETEGWPDGGL